MFAKNTITHAKLLAIGFKFFDEEKDAPYYRMVFNPPFKFGVKDIVGQLDDEIFHLYNDDVRYKSIFELANVISVISYHSHTC